MGIRTAFRGNFRRVVAPGLRFGSDKRAIRTLSELEAWLHSRRQLGDDARSRLAALGASRQEREWQKSVLLYRGILDSLVRIAELGDSEETLWRELDLGMVPDENDWPSILLTCSLDERCEASWRQVAITAFLEFLRQRRHVLELLLRKNAGGSPVEDFDLAKSGLTAANAWLLGADKKIEDITRVAMTGRRKYRRLPYDIPVSINLPENGIVTAYLARWQLRFFWKAQSLYLVDNGTELLLSPGKNSIGRDPRCDVALHKAPADVSRRHLVVDWKGQGLVVLRDISMKGSWIPGDLLEEQE